MRQSKEKTVVIISSSEEEITAVKMGAASVEDVSSSDAAADPRPPRVERQRSIHAGQHKVLQTLSVVNCDNGEEIVPNSRPMPIDNECFSGEVMLLVRTPDVDDIKEIAPAGQTPRRVSQYLKGYKRRFEFQFQVRLKRVPTGPLFLGCEVEEMIKLSRWTKGLTGVLLAMIRRINSGFHYSWGLDREKVSQAQIMDGEYEKTHLSFPVEASMDRIVVTKPGEEPPKLGHELKESNESVKRRRRMGAGSVDWNLEDTYTMCLWSAYCDWIKWKSMNVPGCRPFSLTIVTGKQPIYLSVYELSGITPQEYKRKKPPHNRRNLRVYSRLEFANAEHTEGGIAPRLQGKYSAGTYEESIGETASELGSESDGTDGDSKKLATST